MTMSGKKSTLSPTELDKLRSFGSYDLVSSPAQPGGQVYYEVETSSGNTGVVVYEVHEVYVYIPAELSAAGVELKIGGTVRIIDKVCNVRSYNLHAKI